MSRQSRAEITRDRLLSATLESLHERGYSGTSTQEVCRRAGVSRGTLLHHFPTRIDLLCAARTEPALQAPMRTVMTRFDAEILAAFRALVDTAHLPPQLVEVLPFLTFAVFNGLAVGWGYSESGQEEPVLALMEQLAGVLTPGGVL